MFLCVSSATFLGDDIEVSCEVGLTEMKQNERDGEKSHWLDNFCGFCFASS